MELSKCARLNSSHDGVMVVIVAVAPVRKMAEASAEKRD